MSSPISGRFGIRQCKHAALAVCCTALLAAQPPAFAQGQTTIVIQDGSVSQPIMSPEGRFVVYRALAGDELWSYDRESGQFELLVAAADEVFEGFDFANSRGKISIGSDVIPFDGLFQTFDGSINREIFIYRRTTDTIELVSAQPDGTPSGSFSTEPKITPDGRFVAFISHASNLLPGETISAISLYLYDRLNDTMTVVNRNLDGTVSSKVREIFDISDDGSRIVFVSDSPGLVPNDTNEYYDVFLYDAATKSITRINEPGGDESDDADPQDNIAISGDGQTVVWFDTDRNLDPAKTSGVEQVFLKDLNSGEIRMISRAIDGSEPNDDVGRPNPGLHISANGRYVFFHHMATDMVTEDITDAGNIYVYDRQTSGLSVVSLDENDNPLGLTVENLDVPALEEDFGISNDGRFVVFYTDGGGIGGQETLYVRDRGDVLAPIVSAVSTNPIDPLPDDSVLLEATATDRPPDLSSPIANVEYRIDDAGWLPMEPVDGAFDGPIEQAFANVGDQGIGLREYCVRATDTLNNLSQPRCITLGEDCSNAVDDDGDGKIDGDDESCADFGASIQVACLHEPIYPTVPGDPVTFTANVIDDDGNPVAADVIEIWVEDRHSPAISRANLQSLSFVTPVNGDTVTYGCYASLDSGGLAPQDHFSGWRTVDVGTPEDTPIPFVIPVLYNGRVREKIDIVFFTDRDEYSGFTDPLFLQDVHDLIGEGLWTIPWHAQFQKYFNFWIATAAANTGPDPDDDPMCLREASGLVKDALKFADAGAIVHRTECRDNAGSPGLFTIQIDRDRMQIFAHEMGHRPFGLADEYCCDGGYFTNSIFGRPPWANLFKTERGCQNAATERGYPSSECRELFAAGPNWWLFEPDFSKEVNPTPDLMQGTGEASCPADPKTNCDSFQVGVSESRRMSWMINNCFIGEC